MFAVTSFLSDEGAGADAVGATAANDAARYHLGLQSTSGDKRDKKSHKIGTKKGRGDLVNSLEELCSVMNRS